MIGDGEFDKLAGELSTVFSEGYDAEWPRGRFGSLARRVFAVQYGGCETFRAYCDRRGATPDTVERWQDVPPIPASAWKHLDFFVGDPAMAQGVFRTSGTTGGDQLRGRHLVRRLSLYAASAVPGFRTHVEAGLVSAPILSLIPSPSEAPESSLSAMVGLAAHGRAAQVEWLVDGDGAFTLERIAEVAHRAREAARPVVLVGTALAFVHVLETGGSGPDLRLPRGSRIMETGGFKGLDRDIQRVDLYTEISRRFGVPSTRIVNEYGMTELLSQLYDSRDAAAGVPVGERRHTPPPWLRVRALDPDTLAEMPGGEPGLLCFFDLANLGSISHVLTEDWGAVHGGAVRLLGRVSGAEPRGCSRAMDDLMGAER